LSIGSQFELRDSDKAGDQYRKHTFRTHRLDEKKQKKNKGKSVQVEELKDMHVKNQFEIYALNPKRCSSSYLEHIFEPRVSDAGASLVGLQSCMSDGFWLEVVNSITKGVVLDHYWV